MQWNTRRIVHYAFFVLVVAAIIYFLYAVREVLLVFFLGGLLAYLLFRPVLWIEKRGLKRTWAILVLYLLVAGVVGAVLAFAVPATVRELTELAQAYPRYARQAQDIAGRIEEMQMPLQLNQVIRENLGRVETTIYDWLSAFLGQFYNFLGKIFAIIFSPILAFYILNDWEKIRDAILNLLSPHGRREASGLFRQVDTVLIEFIKGHLTVALFVGTATGVAALFFRVKFPFLIGILAGVTNLVPYFGPFLGGIPAVGIALSQSFRTALFMTSAILVIQQVESNLVTPKIIGDRLGMHPLLIVFALLAGGKLMGIWGMLFAVPIAAVLKVFFSWAFLKAVEWGGET
jgi:predicted PurR-regulated permease PerM